MAPESAEVSFGSRFLIVAYAVGLVLLGAAPIRHQYGGVLNYVEIKLEEIRDNVKLKDIDFSERKQTSGEKEQALTIGTKETPSSRARLKAQKDDISLDDLTTGDRRELKDLLESLPAQ